MSQFLPVPLSQQPCPWAGTGRWQCWGCPHCPMSPLVLAQAGGSSVGSAGFLGRHRRIPAAVNDAPCVFLPLAG